MKNLKLKTLITSLVLILLMALSTESSAQETTWRFLAGDNSGNQMKITTDAYNDITKVQLANATQTVWSETEIQEYKRDGDNVYLRVKSLTSNRIYEVTLYWEYNTYSNARLYKIVQVRPEGTSVTYWPKE